MRLRVIALDYDNTIATDGILHPELREIELGYSKTSSVNDFGKELLAEIGRRYGRDTD